MNRETITKEEKIVATATFLTRDGEIRECDGEPVWTTSNNSVRIVPNVPAGSSYSAVIYGHTPGLAQISVVGSFFSVVDGQPVYITGYAEVLVTDVNPSVANLVFSHKSPQF